MEDVGEDLVFWDLGVLLVLDLVGHWMPENNKIIKLINIKSHVNKSTSLMIMLLLLIIDYNLTRLD